MFIWNGEVITLEELIFDRTQGDVAYLQGLLAKGWDGMTDEEKDWFLNGVHKGSYEASDLNRVESWVIYLTEQLKSKGYVAKTEPRNVLDWTTTVRTVAESPAFTGEEQIFEVAYDGEYTIEAAGAAGAAGNGYSASYQSTGGAGAKLTAKFQLKAGDRLRVVVGGMGAVTNSTSKDGTSGGGGGCTMVLREISSIEDSRYQFTKGSFSFEVLLLAAGGGGGNDASYQSNGVNGSPGEGAAFKSPDNYTAASTTTAANTSSAVTTVMGIQQYITNGAAGSYYTRNNGQATGGYGCGGSNDDNPSFGGGWCQGAAAYGAASWCLDTAATGEDGVNTGDGYMILSASVTETEYFYRDNWLEKDFPTRPELDRIRANVNALQDGFYSLPDWREIVVNNTMDFDQANALEWDLQRLEVWLASMVRAFRSRQAGTLFMIAGGVLNR